jgi:hypothetical protein
MAFVEPDWLGLAGWSSAHSSIAFSMVEGALALVLITTESDEKRLAVAVFVLDGGWQLCAEGIDVDSEGYFGWSPDCVYGWGQGSPDEIVHIDYHRQQFDVRPDKDGWWAFLRKPDPDAGDLVIPERVQPD